MFAPPSGRYLFLGAVALLFLGILVAFGGLPYRFGTLAVLVGAVALWAFLAWFFRDPERRPGEAIVSAADGRVLAVATQGGRWQIAVFMNVTDVHVNRFPLDARVEAIDTRGEGFRPAYAPDASHNRRRHYRLATAIGAVEVVQMTGVVARRLVSIARVGTEYPKGARLGLIVLGSRVDVFLPAERTQPTVSVGDRVVAGVTTIARVIP